MPDGTNIKLFNCVQLMSMCQTQNHSYHLNSTSAFVSDINSTMTIAECERTFTIRAINIMNNKTINMFET